RQRNYDALGPRERFRLLANLALIAERADHDVAAAGRLYLDAVAADPNHEDVDAYRAIGHMHLDDIASAKIDAAVAMERRPRSTLAHAVAIRVAPPERTIEELEAQVPADLRSDPDVAYSLGIRAQQGRRWTEAVRHHRAALSAADQSPLILVQLGFSIIPAERAAHIEQF